MATVIGVEVESAGGRQALETGRESSRGESHGYAGWLVAMLLVAVLLRLPGFGKIMEQDELYTIQESIELFHTTLQPGIDSRPLYYLLQHVLLRVLPVNEFYLRLPPFLFGLLGVLATAVLGRRLFGTTAGVVAGMLAALSPWHLHISGMARYWSLTYLLGALAALGLARATTAGGRGAQLLVALLLVLGVTTHPTFLFTAVGMIAGLHLQDERGRFRLVWPTREQWLFRYLPFALLLLVAWLVLRATGNANSIQNWGGRGALSSLRLVPAMVEWAGPAVCTAGALGIAFALARRGGGQRWAAMLAGGIVVTIAALQWASLGTDVYADYATAALPLVFVGCGALAQQAAGRVSNAVGAVRFVAIAVLGAAVAPSTASQLSDGMRFDYRPAFQHIRETAPELPVLTWPVIVQRYYAPELKGEHLSTRVSFLEEQRAKHGDVWVVASMRRLGMVVDDDHSVQNWLRRNCSLEHTYGRPRFDYRMYQVNLFRCRSTP